MNHDDWEEEGEVTQMFSSRPASEGREEPEEALWNVCFTPKDQRPMTTDQVVAALSRREISAYTLVWREGMQNWVQIGNVPILVQARRNHSASMWPNRPVPTPSAPPVAGMSPTPEHQNSNSDYSPTSRSSVHSWTLETPKPRSKSLAQAAPPKPVAVSIQDEAWNDEEEPTRQMQVHDPLPTVKRPPPQKQRTLMGLGESAPPSSKVTAAPASMRAPGTRSMVPPPPRAVRVGGSAGRIPRTDPPALSVSGLTTQVPVSSEPAPTSIEPKPQVEPIKLADPTADREHLLRSLKRWKLAAFVLGGLSITLLVASLSLSLMAPKSAAPLPSQTNGNATK